MVSYNQIYFLFCLNTYLPVQLDTGSDKISAFSDVIMYGIVKYSPMNVRTSWSTSVYATEYIPPANVYATEMIALAQTQGTTLSVKKRKIQSFVLKSNSVNWDSVHSRKLFWSCCYLSCQEWQLRLFLERIKLLLSNKYRQCKMANKR